MQVWRLDIDNRCDDKDYRRKREQEPRLGNAERDFVALEYNMQCDSQYDQLSYAVCQTVSDQ